MSVTSGPPSSYEVVLTDPTGAYAVCEVLNLSRTTDGRGDRVMLTLQDSKQLRKFLVIGVSYRVNIRQVLPSGTLDRYNLTLFLVSFHLQATKGAVSNLVLDFVQDFRPSQERPAGLGRTFGGLDEPEMPKPPKFRSVEEAEAWMEKHAESAKAVVSKMKEAKEIR